VITALEKGSTHVQINTASKNSLLVFSSPRDSILSFALRQKKENVIQSAHRDPVMSA